MPPIATGFIFRVSPPVLALAGLGLAAPHIPAAETMKSAVDKSGFSLAHPTPAALLRDLTTDRPDATESPFTVDAGHLQLEMDLVSLLHTRLDGTRSHEWSAAACNLRLGVGPNVELGIFLTPWTRRAEAPRSGGRETQAGFGDVTLRAKYNFVGNDTGAFASGAIVDVKLPTATGGVGNGAVEGAIIFPACFELNDQWSIGAMTGVEVRRSAASSGHRRVFLNSIALGRSLTEKLAGYLELTSQSGDGPHVATCNAGISYRLDANLQLDGGAELGVSQAADDLVVFVGMSRRF